MDCENEIDEKVLDPTTLLAKQQNAKAFESEIALVNQELTGASFSREILGSGGYMPQPLLRSSALYRIPDVGSHLATLGYQESRIGYLALLQAVGVARGRPVDRFPGDRTVYDMMAHRQHAKFDTCENLRSILLEEATRQSVPLSPFIEEHEYVIAGFSSGLGRVGKAQRMTVNTVLKEIAKETGLHGPLIKAMTYKLRTTRQNCDVVSEAVFGLFSFKFEVTNSPKIRQAKSRGYSAVPPDQESLF